MHACQRKGVVKNILNNLFFSKALSVYTETMESTSLIFRFFLSCIETLSYRGGVLKQISMTLLF